MSRIASLAVAACIPVALACAACGRSGDSTGAAAQPKRFAAPIFDGLWLGMSRDEAARAHRIRPALTAAGRTRRVWIYERSGDYAVDLTFPDSGPAARLSRIDVHFGPSNASPEDYIGRFARILGEPDVKRRKATINAYGDHLHDQYDTIWSDATQYVFLTERVPTRGPGKRPVYYLTVKKKEITAKGPPTGYVPPPPPPGEDGRPVEEPVF